MRLLLTRALIAELDVRVKKLLLVRGSIRGREHRLNPQEIVQRGTLGVRKLPTVLLGVQSRRSLVRGKIAQLPEGSRHAAPLLDRQRTKLLHGAAHLKTLVRRQVLHRLVPGEKLLPLCGRHAIQLIEPLPHAVLGGLRQIMEARLALQGMLLLWRRKLTVLIHPLRERYTSPCTSSGGKIALRWPQRRRFSDGRAGSGKRRRQASLHRRGSPLHRGRLGMAWRVLDVLLLRDYRRCRAAAKHQHPGAGFDPPSKAPYSRHTAGLAH